MKDFFQRVVDEVATLYRQAAQVEGLQARVNDLVNRVDQLEQANIELRRQLDESHAVSARLENELSDVRQSRDNQTAVAQGLRETIVQRDSRVSELEGTVRSETDAHRITKADLEDSRRATQEQEARGNDYQQRLNDTVQLLEEWRARANDAEKRNGELQTKLDSIQRFLNPIHVVPSGDASVA